MLSIMGGTRLESAAGMKAWTWPNRFATSFFPVTARLKSVPGRVQAAVVDRMTWNIEATNCFALSACLVLRPSGLWALLQYVNYSKVE